MPENANESSELNARFFALASFVLVVGILRWSREILIPLALAAMLAFLLSPAVDWLRRRGLNRIVAVSLTSVVALGICVGLGWIVFVQAFNVVEELPKYETNIEAKIEKLHRPNTSGALSDAAGLMARIEKELKAQPEALAPRSAGGANQAPVPVEVEPARSSFLDLTRSVLTPLLGPLADAGIVAIFVVAILLQRDDLRARFIRLARAEGLDESVRAINDAGGRVSRYLVMQLVVNACYGVPVALGLYFIGVPNASLWGLLATLLRFIPYLGVWIAACFPVALAVAIDPGWSRVALVFGLFAVAEAITANIIEPWVYGVHTGVATLALMFAAIFWTWLWGPAGLFLSTPLTVCVVVLGKHLPALKIFSMLLEAENGRAGKKRRTVMAGR
ncbi:MAG TPA: AI-2E family transporter [Opitutaceae bacterium]|jgi:predicted PurR-regulated permease PerM|nr:AI-2E family transporter [Opitutaceae bacterium]